MFVLNVIAIYKCTMFIIFLPTLIYVTFIFSKTLKTVLNIVTLIHLDIGKMGDHIQKYANDNDMNLKNSFWKKNIRNLPGR